jgi:CspA family cold shock protein
VVATGRVIRFDEVKGYGFITPTDGSEDVFVHANELTNRGARVTTGTLVEFRVIDSERGPKAYDVKIIEEGTSHSQSVPEDEVFEIFSEADFVHQITELLLSAAPQLSGSTILEIRGAIVPFARKNGWIE